MATPGELDSLLVDRGRLKAVTDLDQSLPGSALAFRFEEGTTIIVVNPSDAVEISDIADDAERDDPTVTAAVALLRAGQTRDVTDLTGHEPWSGLIDNYVAWAWNLTSNSGFDDGVQLEFVETSRMSSTIVQLMAEGGIFSIRVIAV